MTGRPFRVDGPRPAFPLVVEASAGTGKTHALTGLAARLLAEGTVTAPQLLVVTFTRAATAELRSRLRGRLVDLQGALASGSATDGSDDGLAAHLAGDGEVPGRLARALAELDAATITTIHGFAGQVRAALGTAGPADPDARLDDGGDDLVAGACADALVAAALEGATPPPLTTSKLREAVGEVIGRHGLPVVPRPGDDPADAEAAALVRRAVDLLRRRRRIEAILDFDDLLGDLAAALDGAAAAPVLAALRQRFGAVLVDEFQDTDQLQWTVLERLFVEGGDVRLVVVGDPKQAIYSFRGAELDTYLAAVGSGAVADRTTLTTNWRSDGAVLSALDALLDGATFGSPAIPFVPVVPAPGHADRRLHRREGSAAAVPAPALRVRLAVGPGIARGTRGGTEIGAARDAVDLDLVAVVRDLLDHGRIPTGDGDRPVRPDDVAVLVRTGRRAERVRRALVDQGVPAVVLGGESVLRSAAADQLRLLLHALDRPADTGRVLAGALSWFVGWDARTVATADDDRVAALQEELQAWSERLGSQPAVDVLTRLVADRGVAARVLAGPDGDRHLTDLDHLIELLAGGTGTGVVGVAGLLAVLDQEPGGGADADTGVDPAARRVESEEDAVTVLTVWKAKGLQFPVVLLPDRWESSAERTVVAVDPSTGRRALFVSAGAWSKGERTEAKAVKAASAAASAGEELRLLYVALTRAEHQTVLWWTDGSQVGRRAVSKVLFGRTGDGALDPVACAAVTVPVPPPDGAAAALAPLVARAAGDPPVVDVVVVDAGVAPADRWVDPAAGAAPGDDLACAVLARTPSRDRHRWSYSALADRLESDAAPTAPSSDPLDPTVGDAGAGDEGEPDPDRPETVGGPAEEAAGPGVGRLDALPAGAAFGTLVHAVLERTAFDAADPPAALAAALGAARRRFPVDLTPPALPGATDDDGRRLLVEGLADCLATPLGAPTTDRPLTAFTRADRLDELTFDLRLGATDGRATLAAVGRLLDARLPDDDPVRPWARRVVATAPALPLAGHLTGSIDLVLRVRGDGPDRFVVADYKTNRLAPAGRPAGRDDYGPAALAAAMDEHDYPLQAVLYSVALHRYLRWRLHGYDPVVHLGGVAYLFVRGMTGATTTRGGAVPGVWAWRPPADVVTAVSDLLAGVGPGVEAR